MNGVDRRARGIAADLIIRLAEGAITNHEFDRLYPDKTDDQAVHQIYISLLSFIDDAFREYALVGSRALSSEESEMFNRCIAFLRTELVYEWPSGIRSIVRWLRLGGNEHGDKTVWPYFRKEDLTTRSYA